MSRVKRYIIKALTPLLIVMLTGFVGAVLLAGSDFAQNIHSAMDQPAQDACTDFLKLRESLFRHQAFSKSKLRNRIKHIYNLAATSQTKYIPEAAAHLVETARFASQSYRSISFPKDPAFRTAFRALDDLCVGGMRGGISPEDTVRILGKDPNWSGRFLLNR